MKTRNIFKGTFFALAVASMSLIISSCDKNDNNDNNNNAQNYTISGNASGSQENPAVTTNGTGTITGTYNSSTNKLDYTINWSNLSSAAIAAHFHGPAAMGVNAAILIDITLSTTGITGTTSASVTLSDDNERALLDGNVYFNVHTATNPNGEIRGQVMATANP